MGEKSYAKNIYANPADPILNVYLALGIWFCLKQSQYGDSEQIFIRKT